MNRICSLMTHPRVYLWIQRALAASPQPTGSSGSGILCVPMPDANTARIQYAH